MRVTQQLKKLLLTEYLRIQILTLAAQLFMLLLTKGVDVETIRNKVKDARNVFILEDDPIRIKQFKQMLSDKFLTMTDDATVAIDILNKQKFDICFLDHDLGGQTYVNSDKPNTGYQVAKQISSTLNIDTFCIVHSMNPVGAQNMYKAIGEDKAAWIPYYNIAQTIL